MKTLFFFTLLSSSLVCAPLKNVILVIGDGMGLASITATRIYAKGSQGKLNIEKFQTIGLSKTHSTDDFTTDSAAGATAFAAGEKSYNGSISMSAPKGANSKALKTIFDILKEKGKSLGIITTTTITHATPACFYAHAKNRYEEHRIAKQALNSDLNFLLGGGSKLFTPLQKEIKESNKTYITSKKELLAIDPAKTKKSIIGAFSQEHLPYIIESKKEEPRLLDMVKWGVKNLEQNKNGYMLVIEAGRIDHAGHTNEAKKQFGEVLEMDQMLGYLLKRVNLKDTLIVVTADHETAGLSLNGYGDIKKVKDQFFLKGKSSKGNNPFISWGTGDGDHKAAHKMHIANHTAIDVPVYSTGKGHEKFSGFMHNNEIAHRILKLMNLSF